MEVWKTEDPRLNFAHYEIYTWTLCHSYLHEKQTSRIQSLIKASRWLVDKSGYAVLGLADVLFTLELHTK